MFDDYVKRVSAQGVPGQQVLDDLYKLKNTYQKQYSGK
jgi:hypothetical protein